MLRVQIKSNPSVCSFSLSLLHQHHEVDFASVWDSPSFAASPHKERHVAEPPLRWLLHVLDPRVKPRLVTRVQRDVAHRAPSPRVERPGALKWGTEAMDEASGLPPWKSPRIVGTLWGLKMIFV